MVSIVHRQGNVEKMNVILIAAQKRLGLYGFEKTTMSEIASDVKLSKASLYYYFPNKENLLRAVLSKEKDEYFRLLDIHLKEVQEPEKLVFEFIRIRHEFFTSFLNLTKFRFSDFFQIKPYLLKIYCKRKRRCYWKFFRKVLEREFSG